MRMHARAEGRTEGSACRFPKRERSRKKPSRHGRGGLRELRPSRGRQSRSLIRPSECLLYVYASVFFLCGIITLLAGVYRKEGLVALAGGVASALFYPAMRQARQIRRENIAIRLLERPLSMAETAHETADP